MDISVDSASVEAIQEAIGETLYAIIKKEHGIKNFCADNGLSTATLHRFGQGGNVTLPNLIRILRGLGMTSILNEMLAPPPESLVDKWRRGDKKKAKASTRSIPSAPAAITPAKGSRYAKR